MFLKGAFMKSVGIDGSHAVRPASNLPLSLRRFITTLSALTLLCVLVEIFCRTVLHWHYPYTWPLLPITDPFRDFYLFQPRFHFFHSRDFFAYFDVPFLYPSPLAIVYRFFYAFPHSTAVFLSSFCAALAIAAYLLGRKLLRLGVSTPTVVLFLTLTLTCSYPLCFEFVQANVEWTVWVLVSCGIWAFLSRRGYSAAVCFGIAGSMKIFPLVYLGLLLSRKQYRETVVAFLTCVLSTLATLWLLCPDIGFSWRGTQAGLATFRKTYMLDYIEVGFDHSLFALPKSLLGLTKFITHSAIPPGPETLARMLAIYLPAVAIIGCVLYFTIIRRLPLINQILCLTIASILLPPVSYDYTLLHLYAPWAVLVLFAVRSSKTFTPGLTAAMICFAVLLAPETEFILHHHSIGGQIKALTLTLLFVIALGRRFVSDYDRPATSMAA
jgi:hypothetical protein